MVGGFAVRPAARIWPQAERYGGNSSKVGRGQRRHKFGRGGKKLTTPHLSPCRGRSCACPDRATTRVAPTSASGGPGERARGTFGATL